MQKRPRKATAHWHVWVAIEVFSVVTKLSCSVSRQRVLCNDRIWSWQGDPGLRP